MKNRKTIQKDELSDIKKKKIWETVEQMTQFLQQ